MNQLSETQPIEADTRPNTYPENVPRPTDPPQIGPDHVPSQAASDHNQAPSGTDNVPSRNDSDVAPPAASAPTPRSWWSRMWHNLGRDAALILPGIFISLLAMPLLTILFSVSIATAIIWVGVLLLPLTLIVAGGFANLSRARARHWGASIAEVAPRPGGRGFRSWIGIMAEGRRWLDLLFEAVFALPIRILTFSVSVSWFFGALGGLTFFFWGRFLPQDNIDLVDLVVAGLNGTTVTDLGFGAEAAFQFAAGLVLLLTFPFVLHALALLEIAAIKAGLAPEIGGGTSAGKSRARDQTNHQPEVRSPSASRSTVFSLAGSEGWFWLLTTFVGAVLVAIAWPVMAALYDSSTVFAMLVALGQSAALVLAVRKPVAAIVVGLVSQIAGIFITADTIGLVWPWTVTSLLALLFLHLVIGLRHSWFHLTVLWFFSTILGALSLATPHSGGLSGALANVITTVSLTTGISIIAIIGNLWMRGRNQLATERQLNAEELAKRQELEERNRIAQELHDVVAHSMSVISVQATTARYRISELDQRSVDEFDSIAGSARQALTEMRGLLAILRGGRDADLAPQPSLEDVPALVDVTRGSGASVDLDFPGAVPVLSPTTSLTAFRVVQESLSNALRHAAGAAVSVTVALIEQHLEVIVINDAPDAGTAAVAGGRSHLGGGFGLKGMRERVEALGGTLQVGPTDNNGFEVRVSLPAK